MGTHLPRIPTSARLLPLYPPHARITFPRRPAERFGCPFPPPVRQLANTVCDGDALEGRTRGGGHKPGTGYHIGMLELRRRAASKGGEWSNATGMTFTFTG